MAVVYKYPLVVTDRQLVTMPKEAKILSVQVQNGAPYMWALVNPENGTEEVPIRIHGTGHNIPDADRPLTYELDMVKSDGTFISGTHYRRENEIFKTKEDLLKSL